MGSRCRLGLGSLASYREINALLSAEAALEDADSDEEKDQERQPDVQVVVLDQALVLVEWHHMTRVELVYVKEPIVQILAALHLLTKQSLVVLDSLEAFKGCVRGHNCPKNGCDTSVRQVVGEVARVQATKVIDLHWKTDPIFKQFVAGVELRVRVALSVADHICAMFAHCAQHVLL